MGWAQVGWNALDLYFKLQERALLLTSLLNDQSFLSPLSHLENAAVESGSFVADRWEWVSMCGKGLVAFCATVLQQSDFQPGSS